MTVSPWLMTVSPYVTTLGSLISLHLPISTNCSSLSTHTLKSMPPFSWYQPFSCARTCLLSLQDWPASASSAVTFSATHPSPCSPMTSWMPNPKPSLQPPPSFDAGPASPGMLLCRVFSLTNPSPTPYWLLFLPCRWALIFSWVLSIPCLMFLHSLILLKQSHPSKCSATVHVLLVIKSTCDLCLFPKRKALVSSDILTPPFAFSTGRDPTCQPMVSLQPSLPSLRQDHHPLLCLAGPTPSCHLASTQSLPISASSSAKMSVVSTSSFSICGKTTVRLALTLFPPAHASQLISHFSSCVYHKLLSVVTAGSDPKLSNTSVFLTLTQHVPSAPSGSFNTMFSASLICNYRIPLPFHFPSQSEVRSSSNIRGYPAGGGQCNLQIQRVIIEKEHHLFTTASTICNLKTCFPWALPAVPLASSGPVRATCWKMLQLFFSLHSSCQPCFSPHMPRTSNFTFLWSFPTSLPSCCSPSLSSLFPLPCLCLANPHLFLSPLPKPAPAQL